MLQVNFGNVTAGCKPCACHSLGSASETCDPVTGMCTCKPGVEGFYCDACQHLHYGFSDTGCQSKFSFYYNFMIFYYENYHGKLPILK